MPTRPLKADYKENVVYLYQFPRSPVIPNVSPFCLKVETWLRMKNISYQNEKCHPLTRSREGLLPFIEFNGKEHCDSSFIISDLSEVFKINEAENVPADRWAIGRTIESLAEDSLIQSLAYFRYSPEGADLFMSEQVMDLKSFMPSYFSSSALGLVKWKLRRKYTNRLREMGIGRHTPEEVAAIGEKDLKCLSDILGGDSYFVGDKPTRVDATVFSVLAQIWYLPMPTPHKAFMESHCRNLINFCENIKSKYWPDWDETCKTRNPNLHQNFETAK